MQPRVSVVRQKHLNPYAASTAFCQADKWYAKPWGCFSTYLSINGLGVVKGSPLEIRFEEEEFKIFRQRPGTPLQA
jgi:hypothetical protein